MAEIQAIPFDTTVKNPRLRAVSYFPLQSYCTRNPSTRAAKPRAAINEGVSLVAIQYCNITSWFEIVLAEIRTRRIFKGPASSLVKPRNEGVNEGAIEKLQGLSFLRDKSKLCPYQAGVRKKTAFDFNIKRKGMLCAPINLLQKKQI